MNKKTFYIALIVAIGLVTGGYFYYQKELSKKDHTYVPREKKGELLLPDQAIAQKGSTKEELEKTLRDLDDTQRLNKLAQQQLRKTLNQATPHNEIQRTISNIKDINEINKLNAQIRQLPGMVPETAQDE